jgi:hypothetical protein
MTVYAVVLLAVLNSIAQRGSKVTVSLYALDLGAGAALGAAPVFIATGVFLFAAGIISLRGGG